MGIGDDAAVGEADDARCVFEQALVVSREDEGKTEAVIQVAHEVNELSGIARIEIGGGFVGEDKRGAVHDGAGDGNTLALSAGEEVGPLICAGGEADVLERFSNASAAFVGAYSLNQQGVLNVFAGGEDGDEVEGLKDEADLFAAQHRGLRRTETRGVHSVDENAAAGGLVDAPDEVQQGRFAATAGAGDGEEFASIDAEVDLVEGGYGAVVEGKSPRDLFNADEWVVGAIGRFFLSGALSGR